MSRCGDDGAATGDEDLLRLLSIQLAASLLDETAG